MRKTAIVCAALLTLTLSACGSTGDMDQASAGGSSDVEQLISEAEAAIKKANSVGGAWRDSSKTLKKAKAALSKGDVDGAKKLAAHAKFEGEMAHQQAMEQQKAGPWLF